MRAISKLAARLGVEPRQNESESFVLPLHNRAARTEVVTVLGTFSESRKAMPEPFKLILKNLDEIDIHEEGKS